MNFNLRGFGCLLRLVFKAETAVNGKKQNFVTSVSPIFCTLFRCSLSQSEPARPCAARIRGMREGAHALGLAPVWLTAVQVSQRHNSWEQDPSGSCSYSTSKMTAKIRHLRPIEK